MKSTRINRFFTHSNKGLREAKSFSLAFVRLLAATMLTLGLSTAAMAGNCAPGTLADYIKLGEKGCTWTDVKFYDFKYIPRAGGLPAKDIKVTPQDTNAGGVDLDFFGGWKVGPGGKIDSTITYEVLVESDRDMSGITLIINGFNVEKKATINVWEQFPGPVNLHVYSSKELPPKPSDGKSFLPINFALVKTHIELDSNGFGTANLDQVTNGFSLRWLIALQGTSSPESGAAGMNYVGVTASDFPEGNITPGNVVVDFATECHGATSASTSAVSIVSGPGDSELLSFLLPSDLAPGQYFVSISDSAEGDANFGSSNCSEVNITE